MRPVGAPHIFPKMGMGDFLGYTPSPRISGIIDLGENREIIYGAQQFRGKILSHKDLAPVGGFASIPLSPWLVSARWSVSRKDWNHSSV